MSANGCQSGDEKQQSPEPSPEDDLVLPDYCSWSCQARLDDGCFVRGDRWTPFSHMASCIKFRVWECGSCEYFYEGWCAFEPGPTYRNLTTMGACPKRLPQPEPQEPLWDYDGFAKERGCYGCRFFEPFAGSYFCKYDGQTRTSERNLVCPLAFGYGLGPVPVEEA
ncbi:MAG: hypothetical protein AB1646_21305 [Thermodesulfobacteriota bacterium]